MPAILRALSSFLKLILKDIAMKIDNFIVSVPEIGSVSIKDLLLLEHAVEIAAAEV